MTEQHPFGAREATGPDDGDDVRAHARRALQDSYDWRDDDERRSGAPAAASGPAADAHAARAAARRLRRSTSRTVGV
jgi:hypothetical protein